MQRKQLQLNDCHLKFAKGSEGRFEGYLSIFDNVDSYGDIVRKGAYEESLAEWAEKGRLPPMLLNHDAWSELPIGIWQSMAEDDTGLRVEGELTPNNPVSEKVFAAMQHGALSGLSIGYRKARWEENDNGGFDLLKIDLREGSVVSAPANEEARVDKVKLDADNPLDSWPDVELTLRDAGFSRSAAKMLINQIKTFAERDAGAMQAELEELRKQVEGVQLADRLKTNLDKLRGHV